MILRLKRLIRWMMTSIRIKECEVKTYTKSEIAINALITAKKLHEQGDYIGSTILAGAGREILKDICSAKGIEHTAEVVGKQVGKPTKDIHDLLADVYNKMKHADRDPSGLVEVSEAEPRALMTVGVTDLMKLRDIKPTQEMADLVEYVRSIKK